MIIDKNMEGAWVIRDIINGYWEKQIYYFYTKKEAIKLFRKYRALKILIALLIREQHTEKTTTGREPTIFILTVNCMLKEY